jgi:cellulose 1,4-beta-cellobiosidase
MEALPVRSRRALALLAVGLAAATGAVAAGGTAGAATGGCTVAYTARQWPGGFTADVQVTNHGPAIDGWTLAWDYANQRAGQAWNATVTQDGRHVTARNAAWNARVGTGASASFGLNGTWTGGNPAPATFTLNGQACVGPVGGGDQHVDNPYTGAEGYVNPEWKARAEGEPGGARVSGNPTGVWLDRAAQIQGTGGRMGLRAHLDAALAQGAGYVQLVLNDLPGRDCERPFSTGDFTLGELARYRAEFVDPIAAILGDPRYARLRIVTVVEVDAVPNLVLGTATFQCTQAATSGVYQQALRYALDRLHPLPNVYTYLSAAQHGWIGWESTFEAAGDLFAEVARGTAAGFSSVDGFITNTADYSALDEPHFDATTLVNGQQVRQSGWVDWNTFVDELSFARALRTRLVGEGFDPGIGMLIDTSRNGWGGPARPAAASTSLDLNTFVEQSRVDRRFHVMNWCNQAGAGLGERPRANPAAGIDAYVWMKPPGESDGSSDPLHPDGTGGMQQPMCDPLYAGGLRNGYNRTGALPLAPPAGEWFPASFRQLLANAYPALP